MKQRPSREEQQDPAREQALLSRAQAGDRAALDTLLRTHEKSIYRFGLRMCGDEDAAREVLQRTMLTALERLDTFRGEAKLSTWLFTLARSACSRIHRRTRSVPLHDVPIDAEDGEAELVESSGDPEMRTQAAEMAGLVASAIKALPVSYREVVALRDVEGLPAEEAAAVLGIEVPALKSRLHRGRMLLKRHLLTLLRESEGPAQAARSCVGLRRCLGEPGGAELDQAACAAIESHMEACGRCAEALGDLRDAAALCRLLPQGKVPEPVQKAVRAAIALAFPPPPVPRSAFGAE